MSCWLRSQRLYLEDQQDPLPEAASYPYSKHYHWWYVVDFLKRILVNGLATFQEFRIYTYEVVILFVVYFLYVYARPYKATFVNILEFALLAYLGLFLILAKEFQQQAATSTQLDATSVDSCGKAVPTISTDWIVLGVLYFLPVTVLLLLVGKWLCSRWFHVLRNKLCTRGGCVEGLQQSGPPSNTHNTATIRNVTEATIELSQRKSSDMES